MKLLPLSLLALLSLASCGDPAQRFAVPAVVPTETVGIAYRSVEVREVTLPTYAQLEEIYVETLEGALTSSTALLWADDPTRASTLELTRGLGAITDARVASEPWPFDSFPDVRVEVRVEEFIASARGEFRLAGQYFIAPAEGAGRERAVSFRLSVPMPPDASPAAIAAARGQAMAELAEDIARNGLR